MAEKQKKEREFIIECIQLYRELPTLWNVKSKVYHDRDKKNTAYETLLVKYKEMFPSATKDHLKKKFNSLRTNYRKELKKHLQSIKSGSGADDIYESSLWYYKEMSFLQDYESAADSESSMDKSQCMGSEENYRGIDTMEDNNQTQNPTTTNGTQAPTACGTHSRKGQKSKRKNDEELLELAAKRLRQKPDGYENWALSCAADLVKMEPMQQIFAKNAIAAIIMEGQLGLLHRNSVKINELTNSTTTAPIYNFTPTPPHNSSMPTPIHYSSSSSPQYDLAQNSQQLSNNQNSEQNINYSHGQNVDSLAQYLSSFRN